MKKVEVSGRRAGCQKNKNLDISGNSKHFSFFPRIFFYPNIYFLGPHATFWNPTITPSGKKETGTERKKRNSDVNSGHLVP